MKICKKCLIEKEDSFFREKRLVCKECHKNYYRKEYEIKNRKAINNHKKEVYLRAKEIIKQTSKKSYLKNREKIIEKMKEYCEKNKEKISKYQKEYNKTEIRKIGNKTKNHERRIQKNNGEKITRQDLKNIIEKQDYNCKICGIKLDFKIKFFVHLDHIIPLSKGGKHEINNLQYLCQKCNLHKGCKII